MEINFKGRKKHYRLTQDDRQFMLAERVKAISGKKEGQYNYNPIGYYTGFEKVLERILLLEISDSDAQGFKEVLDAISEARTFIGVLVSEHLKPYCIEAYSSAL